MTLLSETELLVHEYHTDVPRPFSFVGEDSLRIHACVPASENPRNYLSSWFAHCEAMTEAGMEHMRGPEGMGWRVGVSIFSFFAAVIAVILWLFFYAGNYNAYQNLAIIVVIFLAFVAVMGAVWASWGMRQRNWWNG